MTRGMTSKPGHTVMTHNVAEFEPSILVECSVISWFWTIDRSQPATFKTMIRSFKKLAKARNL
ncbi:hypothetical protein MPTK1_7g12070 [Marchantia polymorpha subsp. ruderalis]|uniref:Uncharacterized protein n=2 Tax=Marchantia polymorpha TaxID=3197 RepID=A0AAF6BYM5_MARPO|nr:hypothetical protein MARPO_0003s0220 [Marchantia polymorpha]PTQ49348.1 hypothetical protein MARPO_0003s0220 [Marchantia polymorpha]BBN17108.1 hypothetical protein Mp_7g12070 [Marchantia polymorpha subsp. ruderalis]BBN17109.1 hypothetical protein Mp_7g12070 [Marchantia polymorpha subsp. ruderalis]|eukprot:PTQ49347.1 hypothetical protein MARPO_0003s0220 [Marchantia polymorpha]